MLSNIGDTGDVEFIFLRSLSLTPAWVVLVLEYSAVIRVVTKIIPIATVRYLDLNEAYF